MLYRIGGAQGKRTAMEKESEPNPEQDPAQAASHVASAHTILKALQEKIGTHPELGAAITKLEMALNILAVKTGGVL
ncbi:MAG: hypothetical protein WA653_14070 [Candidatus Sulfotelmatobacter sp.]